MIPVRLTHPDVVWATKVGKARWKLVVERRLKAHFPGAKEADHIDGAGGELAFCRAMHLIWPASNGTFTGEPDVWPNWEIRTLRQKSLRGVKVLRKDPAERLVVWVRGEMPSFEIMGYFTAGGARAHRDWHGDPGSRGQAMWLVPPERMIPIERGFHDVHAYAKIEGRWECVHCGEAIEWAA